jgi:Cd2+/Zn2+-exporting ATPase
VRDGQPLGWVGLEDRTRPEARHAMDELRRLGVRDLIMVTGDRWSVARRVAGEMGCSDVQAEVLPQDKLALVDALKKRGHTVAVVGDGVNDAPALAAGNLGIAMGAAGSDVAMNSASVALMSSDLRRLPFLVNLSRATTRRDLAESDLRRGVHPAGRDRDSVRPGAADGGGAAAHGLVGGVVLNSARLVRFGEHLGTHQPAAPQREMAPEGKVALQPV